MLTAAQTVTAAEVAFIAGLTDQEINRLFDDKALPAPLWKQENGRRFAPLTAPFATFYFRTMDDLTRSARVRVIETITDRLSQRPDFDDFLALSDPKRITDFDWSVHQASLTILLTSFVDSALQRAAQIRRAERHIVEDSGILGGAPCFAGTRVPIAAVLHAARDGVSLQRLKADYPFLTVWLIEAAEIYARAHPKPGRPRRLPEAVPNLELVRSKVIRRPRESE
jgi:uncharacterized protein (DUF433 family)